MIHKARMLRFALLLSLACALIPSRAAAETSKPTVYLAGVLSHEEALVFTSAVAGADPQAIVLFDSPITTPYLKSFLTALNPQTIVPVGSFRDGIDDLRTRIGRTTAEPLVWENGRPRCCGRPSFRRSSGLLCVRRSRAANSSKSPVLPGCSRLPCSSSAIARTRPICTAPSRRGSRSKSMPLAAAVRSCRKLPDGHLITLLSERAVADACRHELVRRGSITTLVIANPEDLYEGRGDMSCLAPWLALRHDAPLLLTDPAGDDVEAVVGAAIQHKDFRRAESVLLAANRQGIPMKTRPNPVPGDHDPLIDLEPLTPEGNNPYSFAVGRIFHDDRSVVSLMVARQRLLAESRGPRRALIASNSGGSLPLLEMFSRNTAKEFANAGYDTTAKFRDGVVKDDIRRALPEADIFLWEGHHSTLIRDFKVPDWDEPTAPAFIFLQSCLALTEEKAQPLLRRGAVGVIGSPVRTYSASGGACSLAFFDALLYEDQTVGGGLRQAKNFLLAYAQLKDKRLGKDAKRSGANVRAAWAFTLWGDPTLRCRARRGPMMR